MQHKVEQLSGHAKRKRRVRSKIKNQQKNRICVHRSNQHIQAQLVSPEGKILAHAASFEAALRNNTAVKGSNSDDAKSGKIAMAIQVGKLLAERAKTQQITECVFDRSGYKFHGRIAALANAARESGMQF